MSVGGISPGADFEPVGTIATYAAAIIAPAALSGVVKDKILIVALDEIPANVTALAVRIYTLIP